MYNIFSRTTALLRGAALPVKRRVPCPLSYAEDKELIGQMDFSIHMWMRDYQKTIERQFGNRIWFIGLQGSYGRGEATEQSDIDVVLILDHVSAEDLQAYSRLLDALPNRKKVCGFVSGKEELLAWEPADLHQFYYDTAPIVGSLDSLLKCIRLEDVCRAIRMGACNVYHMCVHNMVHEKSADILKGLYKSAAFTLQAIAFLQTGNYEKQKTVLKSRLQPKDRCILEIGMDLKRKDTVSNTELIEFSAFLLDWASEWIRRCKGVHGES